MGHVYHSKKNWIVKLIYCLFLAIVMNKMAFSVQRVFWINFMWLWFFFPIISNSYKCDNRQNIFNSVICPSWQIWNIWTFAKFEERKKSCNNKYSMKINWWWWICCLNADTNGEYYPYGIHCLQNIYIYTEWLANA